jgi:hypothetical protein
MSNSADQKEFSEVVLRKAVSIDLPETRYPGFKSGTTQAGIGSTSIRINGLQ